MSEQLPDAPPPSAIVRAGLRFGLVEDPSRATAEPESAITEVTLQPSSPANAETAFAHHVQRVESGEDITKLRPLGIDSGRHLRHICYGVVGSQAYALATIVGSEGYVMPYRVATGVVLAGSVLGGWAAQAYTRSRRRNTFERNSASHLAETGHIYELYREPNKRGEEDASKPITMRWMGVAESAVTPRTTFMGSIYDITSMALRHDVTTIVVSDEQLKQAMPKSEQPKDVPTTTMKDLVKLTGLDPFVAWAKEQPTYYAFQPAQLRRYVEKELGLGGVDSLMTKLRDLDHQEALLGLYDRLNDANTSEATVHGALLAAVSESITRNVSVDSRLWVRGAQDPTAIPIHADTSVRLDKDEAVVQRTVRTTQGVLTESERVPIEQLLDISEATVRAFDEDPEQLSAQQQKLIIYRRLYDATRGKHVEGGAEGANRHAPSKPLVAKVSDLAQPELAATVLTTTRFLGRGTIKHENGKNSRLHFRQRAAYGLAIAACVGAAVGGFEHIAVGAADARFASIATDKRTHDLPRQRQVDMAWRSGVHGGAYVQAFETAKEEGILAVRDVLSNTFHSVLPDVLVDDRDGLVADPNGYSVDPYQIGLGDAGLSNNVTNIANIDDDAPNRIQWELEPYKMDSEGYWGVTTKSELDPMGYWVNGYSKEVTTWKPPVELSNTTQPHITVSHAIAPQDPAMVAIPMLEGTRLAAANLNGVPVVAEQADDGSVELALPNNARGTLSYTVVKSRNSRDALHSVVSNQISKDDKQVAVPPADTWKQLMPSRSEDSAERIAQETAFIQKSLQYSLTPLPDGWQNQRVDPYTAMMKATFGTDKLANCVVAATLLSGDNPSLTVANGWHNTNLKGDYKQALTSHEAHAWNVDFTGQIHDATPADLTGKYARYFDESRALPAPGSDEHDWSIPMLPLVAALGLAGGVVGMRRRKYLAQQASKATQSVLDIAAGPASILTRRGGYVGYMARTAVEMSYMPGGTREARRERFYDALHRNIESDDPARASVESTAVTSVRNTLWRMRYIGAGRGMRIAVGARLAARKLVQGRELRQAVLAEEKRQQQRTRGGYGE